MNNFFIMPTFAVALVTMGGALRCVLRDRHSCIVSAALQMPRTRCLEQAVTYAYFTGALKR